MALQYKRKPEWLKKQGVRARLYAKLVKYTNAELKKRGVNLTYPELRGIVSRYIYPQFKGKNANAVKVKDINEAVKRFVELLQTSKYYHPLKVPQGLLVDLDWFNLDDFLTNELTSFVSPKDLRIRISAGTYGDTGEMDISEYEYSTSGLQDIVEAMREDVNNSSGTVWQGAPMLRYGKSDDGLVDSYAIRFILYINDAPVISEDDMEISGFELKTTAYDQSKIQQRAKEILQASKRKDNEKIKRARNRPRPKVKEGEKKPKDTPPPTEKLSPKDRVKIAELKNKALQARAKELEVLRQDYKDGIFTKKQYEAERLKIIKYYSKTIKTFSTGGIVDDDE